MSERENPKFKLLDVGSQMYWFYYLTIKNHKTHQFYYSIDTIAQKTGHSVHTVIKANTQLEEFEIMSSSKSHRRTTTYQMKEKIHLYNGDTSFFLIAECATKESFRLQNVQLAIAESATKPLQNVQPTVAESATQSIDLSIELSKDIIIEKNDDDIIKYAEDIADRKTELSEQIFTIQKALIDKYSLNGFHRPPSYQFIKDLLHINEQYGGFDYVLGKVKEMPIPLEPKEIGQTLRGYCTHPEKGSNGKQIKKRSYEEERDRIYAEREQWEREHADSDPKKIQDLLQNLFAKFGDEK